MSSAPEPYDTPTRRVILLGVAFAALVGIGVVTVMLPELEQEPDNAPAQAGQAPDTTEAAAPSGPSTPVAAP